MNVLVLINLSLGALAMGYGAIVIRGVLRGTLRGKWPARFLACSLLASLAGLLPFTRHLAPIQHVCILSVYFSAAAIAAWLKFHLFGAWRLVFALSVTAVLYLDIVSGSTQLFTTSRFFTAAVAGSVSAFHLMQLFVAVSFAVLGVLTVRKCHAEPAR